MNTLDVLLVDSLCRIPNRAYFSWSDTRRSKNRRNCLTETRYARFLRKHVVSSHRLTEEARGPATFWFIDCNESEISLTKELNDNSLQMLAQECADYFPKTPNLSSSLLFYILGCSLRCTRDICPLNDLLKLVPSAGFLSVDNCAVINTRFFGGHQEWFKRALVHELTHSCVNRGLEGRELPIFLSEAFALAMEYRFVRNSENPAAYTAIPYDIPNLPPQFLGPGFMTLAELGALNDTNRLTRTFRQLAHLALVYFAILKHHGAKIGSFLFQVADKNLSGLELLSWISESSSFCMSDLENYFADFYLCGNIPPKNAKPE